MWHSAPVSQHPEAMNKSRPLGEAPSVTDVKTEGRKESLKLSSKELLMQHKPAHQKPKCQQPQIKGIMKEYDFQE